MASLAELRRPDEMPERAAFDSEALAHTERIFSQVAIIRGNTADRVRTVLSTVLSDELIRENAKGADIRRMAMAGNVTVASLRKLGLDEKSIVRLTIGDVDPPKSLPGSNLSPRRAVDEIIQEAHRCTDWLIAKYGPGYDTAAKGFLEARRPMMALLDEHYGFSHAGIDLELLAEQTCLTIGGMSALNHTAASRVQNAVENRIKSGRGRLRHRAIQPDMSFATWLTMINQNSLFGEAGDVCEIEMLQKDLLQPTAEQVEEFYKENPVRARTADYEDTWCIAPVGNPSGTVIEPHQLTAVCKTIIENNPDAVIILDCAYVRTLEPETAKELMRGVINIREIMNRIIFIESFSKTHGMCGLRAGGFFSANPKIFTPVGVKNMVVTAGNGAWESGLVWAASCATPEQQAAISGMHKFWRDEKLGLWHHLNQDHKKLLHADNSHIRPEQLARPGGLYLTPRLAEGVTQEEVALKTECLGVKVQPNKKRPDVVYLRFAFGKLTEPTYSQYIPKEPL